jgi:16S rRNA (cytidine1402-2'-O)-methyltransferase
MSEPSQTHRRSDGILYLVPTPIGNLDDVSRRAVATLRDADVVAAEDTRVARKLLRTLGIPRSVVSYHEQNEESRAPWLVEKLLEGAVVALMSDAGTPLISDPGFRVVQLAIESGVQVSALPGPSAAVLAVATSGLPVDRFHFLGFLPRQTPRRRTAIQGLADLEGTLVFYEAPHRIVGALADLESILGDRPAAVASNLTKRDERVLRGSLSEIRGELAAEERVRGELTVLVHGAVTKDLSAEEARADRAIEHLIAAGVQPRLVRDALAEVVDLPRRELYARILRATGGGSAD